METLKENLLFLAAIALAVALVAMPFILMRGG